MSRPSPPRQWHPSQGFEHAPPPDWFKRPDQQRGRSPHRSYSPVRQISPHVDHLNQRPLSPRGDSKRSLSPRNERPSSPRNDQHVSRRPISPIRPPSPSLERGGSSPRRDRPPSPRRDHPPSPNRDRPLSPRRDRYSPRRDKPLSPGRERPRSPHGWIRARSPPRRYYDWGRRSRSPPPQWVRRSPPRYGPPSSGRSPPRGTWPPPPEWDRYHRPYPDRRSPPRWGPPPPHHWDRRWAPPPMVSGHHPPADHHYPSRRPESKTSPPPAPEAKHENKGEDALLPTEDKDEEIDSFDLAPYDADIPVGQKYVVAVSGFFCKVCHKFYNSESSAKINHCKTKAHYDKFAKWLSEKKVTALVEKRAVKLDSRSSEPPAKQMKIEPSKEEITETETKYDPTQPTTDVPVKEEEPEPPGEEKQEESSVVPEQMDTTDPVVEQNGNTEPISEEADSDNLITNDTKKEGEAIKLCLADYVEATLFNLRKLKVNELKANLEKRGMKSTGLKPLLLKRLEKVLAEEVAAVTAAEAMQSTEEETINEQQIGEVDVAGGAEYFLKVLESDVEAANRKSQWINDREMERELLQVDGVTQVISVKSERNRIFNGRRTNVEWSIKLCYSGELPEDGLQFSLLSHQQLPFVAMLAEDE